MLGFYEDLSKRMYFIEVEFDKFPYKFLSINGNELNQFIESYLQDLEKQKHNNNENNDIEKDEKKIVTFIYENEKYEIFRYPINFKFFYEDKIIFKVYNKSQLSTILMQLNNCYFFYINDKFETKLNDILSSSDNIKEIILYPFFTEFFYKLNCEMNPNINNLKIKKELLEPLQLFIENKEISKNVNEKILKEKTELIEDDLIFIFNKERKDFINKLNDYAEKENIIEPMKIVGNDGIGKSLTLQLYSLIKLNGYYKLYFNLRLFQKHGFKNYFLIELMRGFLSREKIKINDDIKNYMDCVKYLQKNIDINIKDCFKVLMELIIYLKNKGKKYIIILDQFKYEYITEEDFDSFKNSINKKYFRLIICCSLNDGKIKNNMFKELENDILCLTDEDEEMIIPNIKEEKNNMEIDDDDSSEINEENKINLKNLIIFKNRKDNIVVKKEKENTFQISIEEKEDKTINTSNKNINKLNEKSLNKNNVKMEIKNKLDEPKDICELPLGFPKMIAKIVPYQTSPIKIYYHGIIDLEEIIKEKEPEEIYNFMSNFNYFPKYYIKFDIFRKNQKLIGIEDNNEIIDNFKKEIISKIKKNIKNYYNKESNSNIDHFNNNIYNYIIEFKRKIFKYNDKLINLKELYKFSKKFPIKYIITKSEEELNNINFDDSILEKKFTINYSFPFVEYAINSIIDEFDNNNTKIDINILSGSAFGNALELKIIDFLNKSEEKVEIRKVWVLNILSEKLKNEKLREIKKKTLNSFRYLQSEDIYNIKPLKNFNYYYFHPENQDNYLIDSVLITTDSGNNYSLIAFQITKYKEKDNIKSKKQYKNFIINNVVPKFEKLYNIEISKAYLWFILSNEHIKNDKNCMELNNQNINYVFYSIPKMCFFEERNSTPISNLLYFEKVKEALIYSKNSKDYEYKNYINIEPSSILKFEERLYNLSRKEEEINYEKIRKSFFRNNFGLKINDKIKNTIYDEIKAINKNDKNFYLLFLFSFPFNDFHIYYKMNENLIFILKYNNKIHLIYKHHFYEIDEKRKRLKPLKQLNIDIIDMIDYYYDINFEKKEIEFNDMKDLKDSHIIYLYKIYFIED